jgi:hypothetical protein
MMKAPDLGGFFVTASGPEATGWLQYGSRESDFKEGRVD